MSPAWTSWLKFNIVGLLGAGVQLVILASLKSGLGLSVRAATAVAVECAVLHNFIWHECWTWADRRLDFGQTFARLIRFNFSNGLISIVGQVIVTWFLISTFQLHYLIANAGAIGACSLINFFLSDRLVFRQVSS